MSVGPQSGPHVTNAAPGESLHNYGYAFDGVPMVCGKPEWDAESELWQVYGDIAVDCGLIWAGNWKKFKEYPHCQEDYEWKDLLKLVKTR